MQYEEYDQYNNAKSIILKLIRSNISQTDGVVTDEVDTNNTDNVMLNIITLLNTTMSDLYQAVLTVGESTDPNVPTSKPSRKVYWYTLADPTDTELTLIPDIMDFTDLPLADLYIYDSNGQSFIFNKASKIKKMLEKASANDDVSLLYDVENTMIEKNLGYEKPVPTPSVPTPSVPTTKRKVYWYKYLTTTSEYEYIGDLLSYTGDIEQDKIYVFDANGIEKLLKNKSKIKNKLLNAKQANDQNLIDNVEDDIRSVNHGYEFTGKSGSGKVPMSGGAKVSTFRSTNLYITFANLIYNSSVNLKQVNKLFTDIETSVQFIEPDTLEEFTVAYSELEDVYLDFLKTTHTGGRFKVRLTAGQSEVEKAKFMKTLKSIMDEFDTLNANKTYLDQHYNYAGNLNTIGASRSNGQPSSSSRQTATYYDEE